MSQENTQNESENSQFFSKIYKNSKKKFRPLLTMEGLLKQARESLECYLNPKVIPIEQQLSRDSLRGAQGIALITEMKGGFVFGVSGGSGIILCRDINGNWSGPYAIGMGGLSWGFAAGVSKVDHIVILPTIHHVRTFMAKSSLQVRGNVEACIGDMGREANIGFGISEHAASPIMSYSFSAKGLYGGVSIEGAIIAGRSACNEAFYGKRVHVKDIANGSVHIVKPNKDYDIIVHLLNNYCQSMPTQPHVNTDEIDKNDSNNNNNNNNNMMTNAVNSIYNETSIPSATESIIREKPPLFRQNEVSLTSNMNQSSSNTTNSNKNNNNNNNEINYPNLQNTQPL